MCLNVTGDHPSSVHGNDFDHCPIPNPSVFCFQIRALFQASFVKKLLNYDATCSTSTGTKQVNMLNKMNVSPQRQKIFIYIFLTIVTLAVYWQVGQFDFINFDDSIYVTDNNHVRFGLTREGILWAFSTIEGAFWFPLTWLSFMADYELYGLHAGGYHVTNLIFHILSTLLLFWLFHRMTGEIWKSAFVAALFALHPLHTETVVWITKRKDVLSAFFWMLTLCLYVFYTEKQSIKRYLLVFFSFVLALLSKPMVVTLPVVMILLDYWPLKRFDNQKGLSHLILWQLKEKLPLFILSALISIITIYAQYDKHIKQAQAHFSYLLANASVSFMTYVEKTFWPHHLAIIYPFSDQLPVWQVAGSAMLMVIISIAVIIMIKRLPCLFVGWFWYAVTILPVLDIFRAGIRAMSDNYTYLPIIGISIMLAWGIPFLFPNKNMRRKVLWPAGAAVIVILSVFSWRQCGYWKNNFELFNHAIMVTEGNYIAYNQRGTLYSKSRQYQLAIEDFNESIRIRPVQPIAHNNRGIAYVQIGQHQQALLDYNEAVRLDPDYADAYNNRSILYTQLGQYQLALKDCNQAILLKTDYVDAYNNRGILYTQLGQYQLAIKDYNQAILLNPDHADAYYNRAFTYGTYMGQYQQAVNDLNEAARIKPDYSDIYLTRGNIYAHLGSEELGCLDYRKACELGNCSLLESSKAEGQCDINELRQHHSEYYHDRGVTYFKRGQHQIAIGYFNHAIHLKQDFADAYHNRGTAYSELGHYQHAVADFNESIRLNPDHPDSYKNRGIAYLLQGEKEQGCFDFKKACALGECKLLELAKSKGDCR